MVNRVQVFYEGWNERWRWGTLAKTNNPATPILFEYSEEALTQNLELSALHLPLNSRTFTHFEKFNDHLPGIIADALPDGWGRLLMDRLFRQRGLNPASVGVLDRLTYISNTAMGAFSFQPEQELISHTVTDIPLNLLAQEAQVILSGEDSLTGSIGRNGRLTPRRTS